MTDLPMTVLGLGKMGTSRMSPQSDLDLVFIFEDGTDSDLAQKIVRRLRTVLTVKLREGIAYELDMRLRPSGRSGPPAVMLSSFKDHHNNRAHNWEHIAFLADAQSMWQRISIQRISETAPSHLNSKLRRGGLMQAEYSQASSRILGLPLTSIPADITFWSHIQLWERLLGIEGQPLGDIPEFYKANFLHQFQVKSLKAFEKLQRHHSQSVIAAFNQLFSLPKSSIIQWMKPLLAMPPELKSSSILKGF